MTKGKSSINVFYSWQSDSPRKTNLNAIRTALGRACRRLEAATPALKLIPDEATRDTSGSPNIALKILEKIDHAAIFVADVTTITAPGAGRPCPNPNVGYELGYAVATLGWDRVLLLFNTTIGSFPADLPFDFVQNRAHGYDYADGDPGSKRDALSQFLESAIKAVLDKDPKRPAELKGRSRERIQHDSDVENMRWLMRSIHLPTLDHHIAELPHAITNKALWYFENFSGVAGNSLFNVYDPVLRAAVDQLHRGWTAALAHDNQYRDTANRDLHVFGSPGDMPLTPDRQAAWDAIGEARGEMAAGIQTILERLRSDYLEINLRKTNERAWRAYRDDRRDDDDATTSTGTKQLKKKKKKKKKTKD